eukprot:COSAG02_NODE_32143_length_521_cov_1.414692_1_plen_33_part_10
MVQATREGSISLVLGRRDEYAHRDSGRPFHPVS